MKKAGFHSSVFISNENTKNLLLLFEKKTKEFKLKIRHNQLTTFAQHLYCPPRPGSQDPDEAWPLSHEHSLYVTAKLYL